MLITDVLEILQNITKRTVSQVEIAKILGTTPLAINKRIVRKSELKASEAIELSNHFGINLFENHIHNDNTQTKWPDAVEITYYQSATIGNAVKNPLITSIWVDRELMRDVWKKQGHQLRILQMLGDTMDGGATPIRRGDVLLLDLGSKDIITSGIYAYTTRDDNYIFINGLKQKLDGSIKFFYWNNSYNDIIYKPDELTEANFKVIGRVLKNLSACM